jgi:hypothetical protein
MTKEANAQSGEVGGVADPTKNYSKYEASTKVQNSDIFG